MSDKIVIRGAKENNLKNINLTMPLMKSFLKGFMEGGVKQ